MLHTVAEALRTLGHVEEAIAGCSAALQIDAEFAPSHAALETALYQSQRYREGLESMQRALVLV